MHTAYVGQKAGRPATVTGKARHRPLREHLFWASLIAPALLLYGAFLLLPFVSSIYFSLTSWNGVSPTKQFVGLANYVELLGDSRVHTALLHNLIWVVVGTAVPVVLGLMVAVLLWAGVRGALAFRTVFFLPYITPLVVTGIVWGWIYHPFEGALNRGLELVGLDSLTRIWLGDPGLALFAVIGTSVWAYFGFVVVVVLAGLQSLSQDLFDAALVDGANWFQRLRYVIVPGLAPVLTFVTVLFVIGGIGAFDIVFVMTGGGPGTATEVLATYTLKIFNQNRVGYSAALSMVMTLLTLVASIAFIRWRERGAVDG